MEEKDIYSELSSIRNLMERSTKFISLSGLAGILAGCYALIGSFIGYRLVYGDDNQMLVGNEYIIDPDVWSPLFQVAIVVLLLSLTTGVWLTMRQAKKQKEPFWNPVSQRMFSSIAIPLVSGGFFILILILRGQYDLISSSCLIFYGLALISGSQFTFSDVKWLGFCEIILGLAAAFLPGYGLLLWLIGFGILHILYGSMMHFKYKQ